MLFRSQVIAFEPNPDAFTCLNRNTTKFLNVRCDKIALGNFYGAVALLVEKGWGDSGFIKEDLETTNANMRPLDHYDIAPNFIKIDVEGCELKVLKGAAKTIEKSRPKMVIEINRPALQRQGNTPQEIFDWIRNHGYGSGWDIIEKDATLSTDIFNIIIS